jgi:hypothetical protein
MSLKSYKETIEMDEYVLSLEQGIESFERKENLCFPADD